MPSSRGSTQPRDQIPVSHTLQADSLLTEPQESPGSPLFIVVFFRRPWSIHYLTWGLGAPIQLISILHLKWRDVQERRDLSALIHRNFVGTGSVFGLSLYTTWGQAESFALGWCFKWRRQWHPTPVLLPGKSHGRRSLVGCRHGIAKSRTWLNDFSFTFHFQALEKEMATHSSALAWRIPGTGEPGGLPSMGSHRVRHNCSDLPDASNV